MVHTENPLAQPAVDMPKEVHVATASLYKAPELFPDAPMYRREALRAYIESCLVALAKAGELKLTDVFNQPRDLRDVAGRIILGHYIDHDDGDKYRTDAPVPPELANYTIKVRSRTDRPTITDDGEVGGGTSTPIPVSWKKGLEPRKARMFTGAAGSKSGAVGQVKRVEEVWYETGKTEVTLPIYHAWNCLKQFGKYCRRASKARKQAKLWLFVEASVDDAEKPPKRGPGRPPKEK